MDNILTSWRVFLTWWPEHTAYSIYSDLELVLGLLNCLITGTEAIHQSQRHELRWTLVAQEHRSGHEYSDQSRHTDRPNLSALELPNRWVTVPTYQLSQRDTPFQSVHLTGQ